MTGLRTMAEAPAAMDGCAPCPNGPGECPRHRCSAMGLTVRLSSIESHYFSAFDSDGRPLPNGRQRFTGHFCNRCGRHIPVKRATVKREL